MAAARRRPRRSSSAAASLILLRARSLNGFLLGEEAAAHLGVDVRRERVILLGLASLVTAAAVAIAGLIGFVGLVVPHVVRLVVGPNARLVLPLSALFGASAARVRRSRARGCSARSRSASSPPSSGRRSSSFLLRRSAAGYEL